MRRIITFFAGILLLILTMAMLFLASAIYDTGAMENIETYFFQTNELSVMRPGNPVRLSDMNETTMREMLIKKYVTEYFYAVPDPNNIENRCTSRSTLARMSTPAVFDAWIRGEAAGIKSMAENNMMRTVDINGEIYMDGDYWIVPYVLKTWTVPNDMSAMPQITRGILQMNVLFEPGLRDTLGGAALDIGKYLKCGYNRFETECDPAVIFRFLVTDLERIAND